MKNNLYIKEKWKIVCICVYLSQSDQLKSMNWYSDFVGSVQKEIQSPPRGFVAIFWHTKNIQIKIQPSYDRQVNLSKCHFHHDIPFFTFY